MGQRLGGDTAGSAEMNQPKKYSYHVLHELAILDNQTGDRGWRGAGGVFQVAIAQRLAGHGSVCLWEVVSEWLPLHHLFCFFLSSTYQTVLTWTYKFSRFCSSVLSLAPPWGEWASGCAVLSCWADQPTTGTYALLPQRSLASTLNDDTTHYLLFPFNDITS